MREINYVEANGALILLNPTSVIKRKALQRKEEENQYRNS